MEIIRKLKLRITNFTFKDYHIQNNLNVKEPYGNKEFKLTPEGCRKYKISFICTNFNPKKI
jgi:hypothetical protein